MNTPDDGGPAYARPHYSEDYPAQEGMSLRAKFAETFAAAWLPLISSRSLTEESLIGAANELGLAMADDLLRRLRES